MYISFACDSISLIFAALVTFMWIVVGIFSSKYSEHFKEGSSKRFYIFYALTYIALLALCFANSYITMYMCFEMMTLLSVPLVLHDETEEAIAAAKKYLFYSIFGATMALIGLFVATGYCDLYFVQGGSIDWDIATGHETALRVAAFLSIVGFSAKAGMFPLHSWLPTAHPIAPAPASALLSGVITKAGVLCIIRVIYSVFGPELIKGTWVQYTLIAMACFTIFMGSLMAYQQDLFKKRLAYSTVSQVSYVLLGIFALNKVALAGAFLHIIYHSVIKNCLFLTAGATIFTNHKDRVSDMQGLGRKMPITFACFTIASLGLIGIPPFAGFMSKWYIATGIMSEDIKILSWLGPAVLLASALMTAAYLLPISINGFFKQPLEDQEHPLKEAPTRMLVSLLVLACLVVVLGIVAQPWVNLFMSVAGELL